MRSNKNSWSKGGFRRGVAAVAVAALATTALAGCTKTDQDSGKSTLERLREAGSITVAFAGEAPYSFMKDGELTGGTIAIDREIFKKLGINEVKGVKTDWAGLIPGLNAKRYDMVSAGMSILPDRCAQAAFSTPLINYTTALMVKPGNPKNLTSIESIKESGATMAAVTGAIEADYAKNAGIEATLVGAQQDGLDAVASGRVDAFAYTAVSQNYLRNNPPNPNVEVTKPFIANLNGKPYNPAGAAVFRSDDTELLDAYNAEAQKIVRDKAKYMELLGSFGFTEENIPDPSLTTEQLCTTGG